MAIQVASTLTPKIGKSYYLVEDVYIKGGLQVQPDIAARDAIQPTNLKEGSLVLCLDEGIIWKVETLVVPTVENPNATPSVTWVELELGSSLLSELEDVDFTDPPEHGQTIIYDANTQTWKAGDAGNGATGNERSAVIHTIPNLAPESSVDFELFLGVSAIVFMLKVSRPVKVKVYASEARDEPNPYTFLATADHLTDDGSTLLSDGTIIRSRQYSIFVNMDEPKQLVNYFTVESVDDVEGPVTLEMIYLPLEL